MQAESIFTIGLDVDDKSFHGCAISVSTGEVLDFQCEPNMAALKKQLAKITADNKHIRICYEATYLGFSLCRDLREAGCHCDVIAPSLIPKRPGDKVKTDRIDAEKLARYYLAGMLTVVTVPDFEQEMDRDLLRSRKFIKEQSVALKLHINALTRRLGWNFKTECKKKENWTTDYVKWLKRKVDSCTSKSVKANLEALMMQFDNLQSNLIDFGKKIDELCEKPAYKPTVKALSCFRGIDRLTAIILITEFGDIRRFRHPRQVTSYAGLDIVESSSGGHERKFHSSKDGNRYIRTVAVEACQSTDRTLRISRELKLRRQGMDQKFIDVADRCMRRLHLKSRRLLAKGKNRNKVKVACAREMLSFIWESMHLVAAAS